MNRIRLISGFEEKQARHALDLLLRDRANEFKELADSLKISLTTDDWEIIILKFCLDFEDCFKTWTDDAEPDHNQIHKCMTMMREISKDKKSITEIIHIQNIAYNISKDFHEIYKRIR
jgi:hypothetical protein